MAEDNTTTTTNGKKRKHHHQFSKPMKKGRPPLRAGVEGFFITCDSGKERQATDEALNLLYCFYEELLHGDAAFPNVANEQTNGVIKFTDTDSSDHDNASPQKEGVDFQNEANDTEEAPLKKQHVDVEADEPKCQNAIHEKAEMKPIDELVEEELKDIGNKNKDIVDVGFDDVVIMDENTDNEKLDEMHATQEPFDIDDNRELKVGMEFKSLDDAYSCYKAFALRSGFGITKRSMKHTVEGGLKEEAIFTCSKEDNTRKRKHNDEASLSITQVCHSPLSKTDCKARMQVRKSGDGYWILDLLVLEHNHEVDPKMSQWGKNHLKIDDAVDAPPCKTFNVLAVEGGKYDKSLYTEKDCKCLQLGEGDASALLNYFNQQQQQNSSFFHMYDLNDEGRIKNVFWADARCRMAYQYFGDVVYFDTTYITNNYVTPFAPFLGVNHHGQSILLGCSLLADETIETYVWLFKAWLTCMGNRPPNAIITDQCKSIGSAIQEVFPTSRHRFCLGHILKKVHMKLGTLHEYKTIKDSLMNLVYDSLTIHDFEENWCKMIDNYGLQKNAWLVSLFEDRHCWVPMFVKNTFWAGMSISQRNEVVNAYFDDYVTSKTTLKQFFQQYGSFLRNKYETEAREDFRPSLPLISSLKIEEQLCKVYTVNIFSKFQEELKQLIQLNIKLLGSDGDTSIYKVIELQMDKQLHFQVLFNAVSEEVSCLCRSFEFRGILCRHALCVLRSEFITEIPKKYILNRWSKDCKRLHSSSTSSHTNFVINRPVNLFDKLFNIGFQHLLEIAEIGSLSQDRYDSTLKLFSEMKTKLLSYDLTGVDLHTSGLTSSGGSSFTTAINDVECSPLPNKVLDPQSVAKSCPSVNGRALRCENACEKENNDLVVGHVATNEDEKLVSVLDTTELFTTSMIFNYREEMINWAKKVGRDNGIVIVVSKSDYSDRRSPRLYLGCERGGQYRGHRACSPPKRKREKSTKRCGCPFKLKCTKLTALEDKWTIKVLDGTHNHPLIKNAEGRSFGGRLLNEEYEILRDLTKSGVRPRDILLHLKNRDSSNASTLTTIYNARAKMKKEEIGGHSNELFKRLFLSLDPGCDGCIFIQMNRRTGDPTPTDIVQHMMSSAASIRKQMSRFILRILPVEVASYASEEEISNAIKPLVARHFPTEAPTPKKFAVLYEAHATTGIDRIAIINSVVTTVPEPHKVDDDNPDKTIIVQVVKTICLVGVVEKYKEHLKYNLKQLTSPEP